MFSAPRVILLRLTAMAAVTTSTLLAYDSLHPERPFCPLAEACEQASKSALGDIAGVPTSLIGMAAFGLFFLLTLLPVELGRPVLRPAGILAALAGTGLFIFQWAALDKFCPLCLVADGAGLLAGLLTLTWPQLPRRKSGARLPGETWSARIAWTFALLLCVTTPLAWPRSAGPAWVEAPSTDELFEGEGAPTVARAPTQPVVKPPAPAPYVPPPASTHAIRPAVGPSLRPTPPPVLSPAFTAAATPALPPEIEPLPTSAYPPPPPLPPLPEVPTHPSAEPPLPPSPTVESGGPGAPTPLGGPDADPGQPEPTPEPSTTGEGRPEVQIVEYLNAYCAHCRTMHKRIHGVLNAMGVEGRIRRIYTWSSNDYPLWARALAYAQSVKLEDRLFEELVVARSQRPDEVFAAASRAGLDVAALRRALQDATPPARLVHDRDLAQKARLLGLPTIDIGRRRLMGEQSETELRDAIQAALAPR